MSQHQPDPGLFGPASVTWRVHADPVMLLAGLRALLLQALHPAALAGVLEHSDFRGDPWGRLLGTAEYVGTVSYGTREQAQRAAARVRGIHRRVVGVDHHTGRRYRADDPDLVRWVHCCEVESFLSTYRRCGGQLFDGEADRYVREQTTSAALVGLDPDGVPATVAALAAYFAQVRPALRATPEAWRVVRFVAVPPMPAIVAAATPARPTWVGLAGLAFAMLPRWARRLYRLPGLPVTDVVASAQGRALRSALLAVPPSLREGPHLRAARARLARSAIPPPQGAGGSPRCPADRRPGRPDRSGTHRAEDREPLGGRTKGLQPLGEREPDRAGAAGGVGEKRRAGNRGDADLGDEPAGERHVVAGRVNLGGVAEDVVGAVRNPEAEARAREDVAQEVAAGAVVLAS